jgi:hypothetical protein
MTEALTSQVRAIIPNGISIKKVIEHGSGGAMRGRPVGQLILHESSDISEVDMGVYRIGPQTPDQSRLPILRETKIQPTRLIQDALPEVHTLVVPIKAFDALSALRGLHSAAAAYAKNLPQLEEELRVPTDMFGVPGLDKPAANIAHLLGGMISRAQPAERRERPEDLAGQLLDGIGPIIGRGMEAIRAVQDLPVQPPQQPMTPDQMAAFAEQTPPFIFTVAES